VLSELRENQRNAQLAAGFPPDVGFDGRTLSTTFARAQGLLPNGLVDTCLDFFFANVYPSTPVLHRQKAQEAAVSMERSTEAYCLIVALCAYVMIQANMKVPSNMFSRPEVAQMSNMTLGHALLEESVRVRNGYDFKENPTHMTVLTSWFYSGSYFGLARENTAWGYLREATTQAQLLGMHDEETYKHDPLDISRKRVLYWLLFIAERYDSLDTTRKSAQLTLISGHMPCTNIAQFRSTPLYTHLLWTKYHPIGPLPLDSNFSSPCTKTLTTPLSTSGTECTHMRIPLGLHNCKPNFPKQSQHIWSARKRRASKSASHSNGSKRWPGSSAYAKVL
jgi:hypothetical protein